MQLHYQSPYDVPREAEAYAASLATAAMRITLDVMAYSVLPGLAMTALAIGWAYLAQHGWPDIGHIGVNGLAALSVGCTRLYMKRDSGD